MFSQSASRQRWVTPPSSAPQRMLRVVCRAYRTSAMPQDVDVAANLKQVLGRVRAASDGQRHVELVAVSKTKPAEAVRAAYDAGQRTFGENYVQEIVDKAPLLPADIRWHFIGHLQSNKIKALLGAVPNLTVLETVDSTKLADKLSAAVLAQAREPLEVMVQVNTSGEESKHGVEPGEACTQLARHIRDSCPGLRLCGLMTIGQPDYSSRPENFSCLAECRRQVSAALGVAEASLHLSMGMSGDYEAAIRMGATSVRVGSSVFGARDYGAAA